MLHRHCRNAIYLHSTVARFPVPDDLVSWLQPHPSYTPPEYESPVLAGKPWADPGRQQLLSQATPPQWNCLDGDGVNRRSHEAAGYLLVDGMPRNSHGRTGLLGRGLLGRWGPNHAADPVITRWKRAEDGAVEVHSVSGRRQLQMVAIRRRDTGQWAIPGRMVDAGETVSQTLRREFAEEALNCGGGGGGGQQLDAFFAAGGEQIYAGYVDDPRNTDNAWMETVACGFHDEGGEQLAAVRLEAGDDAAVVRWMDVAGNRPMYANHAWFVEQWAQRLGAHW